MEQLDESQDSGTELPAADESLETSADTSTSPDDVIESQEPTEPVDDSEEIEHDGEKYKVPKALKDAFLRQQDYTQKTQSVAEQRKAVEAQAAEVQQRAQAQQAYIAEHAEAIALDNQLKQYAGVNWSELIDSDPVQAMKLDRQMRELQQRRDAAFASVTQKQRTQAEEMQRETAKRIEEGRAVLEREIKDWSPEKGREILNFGATHNIPAEALENFARNHPGIAVALNKALQFDQLMKKQVTTSKAAPAPQEKPVTRIAASKGTAAKDPAKMTDAEFSKWRKSQIAQR